MIARCFLLGLLFCNAAMWLETVPWQTCWACYDVAPVMWLGAVWCIGWAFLLAFLAGLVADPEP